MSLTNYGEAAALDALFTAQKYIALLTAVTDEEAGTFTEVANSGAYARKAVTMAAASGGSKVSSADVVFDEATGNWGTVTHYAIVDSATYGGGNVIGIGALTASRNVTTGVTLTFSAGDIALTMD